MSFTWLQSGFVKGLSFSRADLALAKAWAEGHEGRMVVQLDHGIDGDEFEETLIIRCGENDRCCWILWQGEEMVWVQPLIGRPLQYKSLAEAIIALAPEQAVVLTDISAARWG